jgi:glycosyltransferase involved in cell wall biosynthesis
MARQKLSVAIASYKEAEIFARCLDAINNIADEIVVVDGNSNDGTRELLKKYSKVKAKFVDNNPMFHINKQMAIDMCSGDWVLQLDVDEVVTPQLATEIVEVINSNPSENGFWINRSNYFLGRFLKKGGVYPDPTIRLYKKGKGRLPCKDVHEQAEIDGKIGHLKHDLLHFSDPTFKRYLMRSDRYTTLLANDWKKDDIKINLPNTINYCFLKPIYWFLLGYVRNKGFVDGWPGFVWALYSARRFPVAYFKLWKIKK